MFITHFERGFALPASDFFRSFLDFFGLQPHHLLANSIVSLSAFAAFCEGYLGSWPTTELWSKFFRFRKHTIPGSDLKPLVACGSVSISPRGESVLPRIQGLDTVKKWQRSFFYVKSAEGCDALNLPEFNMEPPVAEKNFKYSPAESEESGLVDEVLGELLKQDFNVDDLLCTMVARRVCPLQRWVHKICHMSGLLDPTRLSRHQLDRSDVMKRVRAIATSALEDDWVWHVKPYHRTRRAPQVSSFANPTLTLL